MRIKAGTWFRGEETNPVMSGAQADSIYGVVGRVGNTDMLKFRHICKISEDKNPSEEEKTLAELICAAPNMLHELRRLQAIVCEEDAMSIEDVVGHLNVELDFDI